MSSATTYTHPGPPPLPPERPVNAPTAKPWPAWFAAAGGIGGLFLVVVLSIPVVGVMIAAGLDEESTAVLIVGTLLQEIVLVGVAVLLARTLGKVRAVHFGVRKFAIWPAVGWTLLALVIYYSSLATYASLVNLESDTAPVDLGADNGQAGILAFVAIVVLIAPIAEELFFRGFIFKALQSRFAVWGAAFISSAFFGLLHWDFQTLDRLLVTVPLTLLGLILCWLYYRTGSILPAVAAHAINNGAAAFSFAHDNDSTVGQIAAVVALLIVLISVVIAPRFLRLH